MTDTRMTEDMPSRRELAVGMVILLLVGGFAVNRGRESLRPAEAAPRIVRTESPPPAPAMAPSADTTPTALAGTVPWKREPPSH